MELPDYLQLLLRSWAVIAIGSLLGVALATAYLIAQPVLYSATASTYVSVSSASDISSASTGSTFAKDAAADLAVIATSPYVLDAVRRDLSLSTPSTALASQISTVVVPDTSVIEVTATTTQPSLSSAVANAVVTELGSAVARLNPNVGNAASVARTTTLQRATTPSTPVSPSVVFDVAVGLLGGFSVALLLILLRQAIDQRIRNADQLGRVARAPVVGVVPEVPPASEGPNVVLDPARIGQFRAIRSEILEGASQRRVIVVSGTKRSVSTSSLASSIAASVASAQLDTLLLDAVTVSSPAAPIFRAPTEPGLTEVLERSHTVERSIVQADHEGLWYLPPGRPSGRRDDLIASLEMTDLLEAVISRFNVVIINADPVEDSPIARTLGRQADGVVLSSELNRGSAPEVRRAVESLERGGARLLGVVMVSPAERARSRRADRSRGQTTPAEA